MNQKDNTLLVNMQGNRNDSLEGALDEAYMELGKALYTFRFEEPTPELLPYFDRITELIGRQKARKSHLEAFDQHHTPEYSSIRDLPSIQKSKSEPPRMPQTARFCPGCGTPIQPKDLFCGICGARLK